MKTIPPAETFIINKMRSFSNGTPPTPKDVEQWLIEFAQMHVTEAKNQFREYIHIIKRPTYVVGGEMELLPNSIDNVYPLSKVE